MEYEIPRRQRRIDAVLIADTIVLVIEFKVGATSFERAALWQVEDYALDLRDFHKESHGRVIVPVLVATDCVDNEPEPTGTSGVTTVGRHGLAMAVLNAVDQNRNSSGPIDARRWIESPYQPTPTIVTATQQLFAQHSIRDLSHAYADNLTLTVDAVVAAIDSARANGTRCICFVTGVPGAGKTLAGMAAVQDSRVVRDGEGKAAFMSGNGPLVRVLREALVRDALKRGGKRATAAHWASLLVQNIHEFINEHGVLHTDHVPHEHVIVFDEAQRAWDAEKMTRYHRRRGGTITRSEPALVLEIMSRVPDWCAIVAVIGGGQEIHDGEAGLEEWGRALANSQERWHALVSPEALEGGASVAHHRLFASDAPPNVDVLPQEAVHLSVSVRSPRAQRLAEWVNAVLALDVEAAQHAAAEVQGFRMAITRDVSAARSWLRDASRGEMRAGLLASSGSLRHRAYGIEMDPDFHRAYPVERWFLDPSEDVRSSHALEVALTEFECQGLELDLVGLCWGDDFTLAEDRRAWSMRSFRGAKWQSVNDTVKRRYLLNKYRVLMSRAREGMVVWVPRGSLDDPTREPERLNRTADFLVRCGLQYVE